MDRKETPPSPKARAPLIAVGLLIICFAARVTVVSHALDFEGGGFLTGPLTDDSFYSLNIARNLSAGHGFTFDRINPTNGFQPLYVFLMAPAYTLWPDDPIPPVKIAMLLLALASTAAGFSLWRILRREVSDRAGLFGLALFALSPYAIDQGVNGLETSLVLLLFLAAYDLYLARIRPGVDSRSHRLALAALLALLVFARVDGALLAAAIAFDYLFRRDPLPFRARLIKMSEITIVALALYSPWLVFSWVHFGTPLPQSGAAVRLMAQLYGDMELPFAVGPFVPGDIPAGFYAGHLVQALMVLGMAGLFFPASPVILFLQLIGSATGAWAIGSWIVCVPVFLGSCVLAFRARGTLGAVWWAAGLTVAAYGFYTFGAWFFFRYLYVVEVCLLMAGAALFEQMGRKWRWTFGVAAAAFAVVIANGWYLRSQANDFQLFNYDLIGRSLEARAPATARAGTFQTGFVGYFSRGREVVNLDGVVNPQAYEALRDARLYAYLKSERIEYVADFRNIIDRLLLPRLGADPAAVLVPLSAPEDQVQVFRVK